MFFSTLSLAYSFIFSFFLPFLLSLFSFLPSFFCKLDDSRWLASFVYIQLVIPVNVLLKILIFSCKIVISLYLLRFLVILFTFSALPFILLNIVIIDVFKSLSIISCGLFCVCTPLIVFSVESRSYKFPGSLDAE